MPKVVLCGAEPIETLTGTFFFREDVERHVVEAEEALERLTALSPDLLAIGRDLPSAYALIRSVRREDATRRVSIVVLARSDFDPAEVELLEAGANAILRFPPGPGWDERLERLTAVPIRRDVRFPVHIEMVARSGVGVESLPVTALNLSRTGLLVESAVPFHVGDDLDVHFRLPEGEAAIAGCARVVRQAGRGRYGLEFYGLEGDGAERIQCFVEALASV